MTQTTGGARSSAAKKTRPELAGLNIDRIYTTPGVHPYDDVTWEHRDVVQTNWKTGETVFARRRRGALHRKDSLAEACHALFTRRRLDALQLVRDLRSLSQFTQEHGLSPTNRRNMSNNKGC